MSQYPDKIRRLFKNPRRVGRLEQEKGVGMGKATTPANAAELAISLRLDDDGRIADACYQALGCPYLIATGSWVCAQLIGRKQASVEDWSVNYLTEQLELPAVKRYCAVMALDALQQAITAAQSEDSEVLKESNDE